VDLIRTKDPALAARLEKVCRHTTARDEYLAALKEWLGDQEKMKKEKAQSDLRRLTEFSFSLGDMIEHEPTSVVLSVHPGKTAGYGSYTANITCHGKSGSDLSDALRQAAEQLDRLYSGPGLQKELSVENSDSGTDSTDYCFV
jgi:hypothetical protein